MRFTKAKAYVAFVALVVEALTAAFADDVLSLEETGHVISTLVVAAAGAWSVFRVRNKPVDNLSTPNDRYL
jgi:hypothetical protein